MHVKHEIGRLNSDAILFLKGMFEGWEVEDGAQFRLKVVTSDVKNLERLAAFLEGDSVQGVMSKLSYFIIELHEVTTDDLLAFFAHFTRPDLSKFVFRMGRAQDMGVWLGALFAIDERKINLPAGVIFHLRKTKLHHETQMQLARAFIFSPCIPDSFQVHFLDESGNKRYLRAEDMRHCPIEIQINAEAELHQLFQDHRMRLAEGFEFMLSRPEDLSAWMNLIKNLPNMRVQLPQNITINLSRAYVSIIDMKRIERHIVSSNVYPTGFTIIYRGEDDVINQMVASDIREHAPPLTDLERMLYQAPVPSFMQIQPVALSSEELNKYLSDSLQEYTNTVQSPKAEEEDSEVSLSDLPKPPLMNATPIPRRPRHVHVRTRDRTWSLGSIEEGDEEVDKEDDSHSNTQSEDAQLKIG